MYLQALISAFLFGAALLPGNAASLIDRAERETLSYLDEHREAWYETWRSFDVDPCIAEAVVYPEMRRYDKMKDVLENAAVTGTYIRSGSAGFDFSVGRFQMKPSFIEDLEKAWMRSGLARPYECWFDTADNADARRVRLSRLQKEEWQVIYLGVFMRLLYASYGSVNKKGEKTQDGIETLPVEEQVRLAATAYNHGCVWAAPGYGDPERIRKHMDEKKFHYAVVPTSWTRKYCYSRLALHHYRSITR